EAGEAERGGHLAAQLRAAGAGQARDRDARPRLGSAAGLLPAPELVGQERVDPPGESERHRNLLGRLGATEGQNAAWSGCGPSDVRSPRGVSPPRAALKGPSLPDETAPGSRPPPTSDDLREGPGACRSS